MSKKEKKSNGVGKFIAGAAVGATLGILFAPKSGKETRQDLKRLFDDFMKKVKEKCEELVQLAIAKGTPVLEKAANEVREKTIQATREILVRLEEADRKAKAK